MAQPMGYCMPKGVTYWNIENHGRIAQPLGVACRDTEGKELA